MILLIYKYIYIFSDKNIEKYQSYYFFYYIRAGFLQEFQRDFGSV